MRLWYEACFFYCLRRKFCAKALSPSIFFTNFFDKNGQELGNVPFWDYSARVPEIDVLSAAPVHFRFYSQKISVRLFCLMLLFRTKICVKRGVFFEAVFRPTKTWRKKKEKEKKKGGRNAKFSNFGTFWWRKGLCAGWKGGSVFFFFVAFWEKIMAVAFF